MELFAANRQWASRPNDQRFKTLEDLYSATKGYADKAVEKAEVLYRSLKAEVKGDDVVIARGQTPASMTHWAFGQLASAIGAPAGYLRGLPAELAVQNINHGLALMPEDSEATLLFHVNGGLLARAITSNKYARIWNYEVVDRLLNAPADGWNVPKSYTDAEKPSGLYASDHDMFVFLVNENNRINDGTPEGLARGFFVQNSEVGASSLRITKFLYRYVCGNHIVWGAKDVLEIAIRHIGDAANKAWPAFESTIKRLSDESASDDEAKIVDAKTTLIGNDKESVLDTLFGKRYMSRKAAGIAYDAVELDVDGDPRSVWGFVQGATRVSQNTPYADERVEMERSAAKILAATF